MKRNMISILAGAALMLLTACTDDVEMRYPPKIGRASCRERV